MSNTNENTGQKLTISNETQAYLKCLQQLRVLYGYVYNALELSYGWERADDIMDKKYNEKSIYDFIRKYLFVSIDCRLDNKNEFMDNKI